MVGAAAVVAALAVAAIHWMSATAPSAPSATAPKPALRGPGGTSRGRADAPVTVEVFSDFLCSHCAEFAADAEPAIISEFVEPGIVRLVYRHFPLQPFSAVIAEASECAAEQQHFWAYHDVLFDRAVHSKLSGAGDLRSAAQEIGLDGPKFVECIKSGKARARVEADRADGERRGVDGTPTIFIGNQKIVGAQPIAVFREAINAARPR
jgi:protein-disulfide isomerase